MTCKCFARCEADCVCDHDWTPPAVISLREEVERLRAELAGCQLARARDQARVSVFMSYAARMARAGQQETATKLRDEADRAALAVRPEDFVTVHLNTARKGEGE